jgi:hypothetical protein
MEHGSEITGQKFNSDHLQKNEIPNNLEKTDGYFSYMKSFEYYDYRMDSTVIKNKIEAVKKIKSITY